MLTCIERAGFVILEQVFLEFLAVFLCGWERQLRRRCWWKLTSWDFTGGCKATLVVCESIDSIKDLCTVVGLLYFANGWEFFGDHAKSDTCLLAEE